MHLRVIIMKTYSFSLELPFRQVACILTDSSTIIESLGLRYGNYLTEKPAQTDLVIEAWENEGHFLIGMGNHWEKTVCPLKKIEQLYNRFSLYDDSVFALHGAAVAKEGAANVFLAPTQTGKSTLTTFLINRKFKYITDDCVLIDKKSWMVFPCPIPICLREGGCLILKNNGVSVDVKKLQYRYDDFITNRFVFLPNCDAVSNEPLELGKVFFIERSTTTNSTVELSHFDKVQLMIQSPMIPYKITKEYIGFIMSFCKKPMQKIIYRDLSFVNDCLW